MITVSLSCESTAVHPLSFQTQLQQAQDALNKHKETLKKYNQDIAKRDTDRRNLNKESKESGIRIQEFEHKIAKFQKESKEASRDVSFVLFFLSCRLIFFFF